MSEDMSGAGAPKKAQGQRMGVKVQADDTVARGVYSNTAVVNMNENELTLDFLYIPPQAAVAYLRSRVQVSPRQARLLQQALAAALERYEQSFGPVPVPAKPDGLLH